ncbi:hypothetical protein [Arcobacter porcinus]|uniref:Lipoprotein n=1 Tax=Arcobacter porcinus TaxID=1935204 RepID=A0A5C2HD62_9BACT|nr:hypothetical protein [Arcobacter porcinus]OCL90677.1 hypothetical protein AAX27_01488 [Aliarcobacter thereius]QEP40833.1 hypothetical protein APORC_1238 [Arcobacter porcinus]
MKKVIQILIICVSIILLGCTNKNQSVKSSDVNSSKINTELYYFGNKSDYIKKLTFFYGLNKQIVFYIDKIPYKQEFDLCENSNSSCQSYFYLKEEKSSTTIYLPKVSITFPDRTKFHSYGTFLTNGMNIIERIKPIKILIE